ncbi:ribonucleoprotein PTB-binding 2-like isoform X2 [Acipenser ruthenus]|uniref:ribonucleoprotein PTB-binding 2-like isoform X2 n=1 Tax=Acipenser ruthenus TaxID=7906 RepID=UPI00274136B4|nr:ribonucleoprotein PTB-binding 2-like isoform X2 [Acipenser ruthenus]
MAAASSLQLPLIHNLNRRNSPVPDSDSPENRQDDEPGVEGPSLRVLADLEPEEIERRLEKTRRELSNRRKILMKNLPQDISNQEVHDILKEYELKYCYVDRNKGTAFVTLLNGEQAQDAIRIFHQTNLRGRELSVQLQPTDSLLCITNLPHTYTLQQFEELVRMYGNIERCFLACSEVTGHSKGYGFVEYMKKDSASKARSELLGRQLGDRTVMVQWTDVNQLTADNLHSKCLCVDKLPSDFSDSEELEEMFSKISKPVFCQLAQDEGSPIGGFAVLEYETAEQAEEVLREMDRQEIGGSEVRVSFCAPGTAGRSTLAALIAAQGVMANNKKGLLPEPSIAQMLNSMTNPAALQVLMRPYHAATAGKPPGIVGLPQGMPFLRSPPLTAALLQLGKVQQLPFFQNAMLGNGLVLQNIWRMQLAHQQLVQLKEKQANHASSLLGDPSRVLLQKAMGMRAAPPVNMGKGLLGDSPNGLSSEAGPTAPQTPGEQAGMIAYMSSRRHLGHAAVEQDGGAETQASAMGGSAGTPPGGHGYLQGLPNPMVLAGAQKQQSLPGSNESSSTVGTASSSQTSLLGEPPKELKVPSNPYLNMASVLPGVLLQASHGSKPQSAQHHSGVVYRSTLNPTVSQTSGPYAVGNTTDYSQQYGEYSQEAMQQWYQHYQAQGYASNSSEAGLVEYGKEQTEMSAYAQPTSSSSDTYYNQATAAAAYGDYNSYMQAVSQYYSQTHMAQAALQSGYQQRAANKEADMTKAVLGTSLQCASNGSFRSTPQSTAMPAYNSVSLMSGYVVGQPTAASSVTPLQTGRADLDWSQYYYNNSRGQKRDYSHLPSQEATPEEGYVGQHSQGLGGQYADSYFKKKRI